MLSSLSLLFLAAVLAAVGFSTADFAVHKFGVDHFDFLRVDPCSYQLPFPDDSFCLPVGQLLFNFVQLVLG